MKRDRQRTAQPGDGRSALVQIEKPIYGGAFLARAEGKAMFVPLTLPGEDVRIRIVEEKRSYASAEPEAIVSAAANRVQPDCIHFGVCGGCQYQHTDYLSQLEFKQAILRETLQRSGVEAPGKIDVLAADPWRYRNRIRLAVDNSGRVGYRARRSHAIVPIGECPIAAPLLVKGALSAGEVLRSMKPGMRPTEISLFSNADETDMLVGLFVQSGAKQTVDGFADALKERVPELAGVQLVEPDRTGQVVKTIAEWGDTSITYRVGRYDYQVGHGAFFQVNRWMLETFVDRVTANWNGTIAWDLFAGVGLFARRLAETYSEVIAVESAPASTGNLNRNLESTRAKGIAANVAAFLKTNRPRPDLIVVDPPRTGLGAEVASRLASMGAPSMVYVSCDPATLARDLRTLISAGYAVSSITLADLFPQTFHLETVVELHRS